MSQDIRAITQHIPSTAAGTDDEWYITQPFPGKWRIVDILFAPATAVAIAGTNFTTVTCTTNDGAAGADSSSIGSFTTNTAGTALALKTTLKASSDWDVTLVQGTDLELVQGAQLKIAKADDGSGKILDGTYTVLLEKMNVAA